MLDDDEREFYRAWKAEGKRRHKAHVARNKEDYQKYITQVASMGADVQVMGAGYRFTFSSGLRVDFWTQSGKWTVVGTNRYELGPKKMVKHIKAQLAHENIPTQDVSDKITGCKASTVIIDDPYKLSADDSPPWEV